MSRTPIKLLIFTEIRASPFIGQANSTTSKNRNSETSKGQSQKEQEEVVKAFRAGVVNVLVATCIAEEGLDIGEVDLIICYDSVSSPIRHMQRMGRTGRKSDGRVVMLVTDGMIFILVHMMTILTLDCRERKRKNLEV